MYDCWKDTLACIEGVCSPMSISGEMDCTFTYEEYGNVSPFFLIGLGECTLNQLGENMHIVLPNVVNQITAL